MFSDFGKWDFSDFDDTRLFKLRDSLHSEVCMDILTGEDYAKSLSDYNEVNAELDRRDYYTEEFDVEQVKSLRE